MRREKRGTEEVGGGGNGERKLTKSKAQNHSNKFTESQFLGLMQTKVDLVDTTFLGLNIHLFS